MTTFIIMTLLLLIRRSKPFVALPCRACRVLFTTSRGRRSRITELSAYIDPDENPNYPTFFSTNKSDKTIPKRQEEEKKQRLWEQLDHDDVFSEENNAQQKKLENQRMNTDGNVGSNKFQVTAPFEPTGDQPQAIEALLQQIQNKNDDAENRCSVLRGITGTGKTLVMAHVIAKYGRPTLVLCHNKTLAAQLARELKSFLRPNAVELFVSYYNHYVPESYNEVTGKYRAKKSSINADIDTLRHRATRALVTRKDVVVVASVSCIYGLGLPKQYLDARISIHLGMKWASPDKVSNQLEDMLYTCQQQDQEEEELQNSDDNSNNEDSELKRGNYLIDIITPTRYVLSVWPPSESFPIRVEIEKESNHNIHNNNNVNNNDKEHVVDDDHQWVIKSMYQGQRDGTYPISDKSYSINIFPAKHHNMASSSSDSEEETPMERACLSIENEMMEASKALMEQGKVEEATRLTHRVTNDLLLLRETGFCKGIENYSRHFTNRQAGQPPDTLLDYFNLNNGSNNHDGGASGDWLLLVDESHVALPQLKAMYNADRARKLRLVKHGFRLPSALDNRPLHAEEFWENVKDQPTIFVSATPSKHELAAASSFGGGEVVDMIIRPTYVCDPEIVVRPTKGQLDDLLEQIQKQKKQGDGKTLAVTVTKRDAEDLSSFLVESGVRSTYIHSGLTTHERSEALKALQRDEIDCLVGVNLLREGLDLPQVSLVAILDADSEGFLRSETALIQMVGRAARNINGLSIFYADRVTPSMKKCIEVTKTRREKQLSYNKEFGCKVKSTKSSSTLSIFDLLKEKIKAEQRLQQQQQQQQYDSTGAMNLTPANGASHTTIDNTIADVTVKVPDSRKTDTKIITEHVPTSPGVYLWRDRNGHILYIGKAKKLRSRVRSYLSPGSGGSSRIRTMIKKAETVDIVLTPSDRDALILESNLIKFHQPPYNVLLKDDDDYPYICASVGDRFPRFFITTQRQQRNMHHQGGGGNNTDNMYRYFGPYPHWKEINTVLDQIEAKYGLRKKSFMARHGSGSIEEYKELFSSALREICSKSDVVLSSMRSQYEEAGLLFDNAKNRCRDVVAMAHIPAGGRDTDTDTTGTDTSSTTLNTAVVQVLQLREGLVSGRFSYTCELPCGMHDIDDYSTAIQHVLVQRHYPSGGESLSSSSPYSFFPNEVLLQYPSLDGGKELREIIHKSRKKAAGSSSSEGGSGRVQIRTAGGTTTNNKHTEVDKRTIAFAIQNVEQVAKEKAMEEVGSAAAVTKTSLDGTALEEIANLLSLEQLPSRIECYDISHTQGKFPVGSRVVFVDGQPASHLYRQFNIQSVTGIDDYASLEEVLERRFRRAWVNGRGGPVGENDPWAIPDLVLIDGGKGQLNAAIKGMAKSGIYPRTTAEVVNGGTLLTRDQEEEEKDWSSASSGREERMSFVGICALAKDQEELFIHGTSEAINDSPDSPAMLLLRALRDESHRFALNAHRRRRSVRKQN